DTSENIANSDAYSFFICESDEPMSSVDLLTTWTKTTLFTVTAAAYDDTGVANVTLWSRCSTNGRTDWTSYGTDEEEPWSWEFTGSDGFCYEFYSIAVDVFGNIEEPPSTADTSTCIDTVLPVTTIAFDGTMGGDGWYVSTVTVTLSATDELSGIESIWYKLDSGYEAVYSVPFTVSKEGEHTVKYYSFDKAGNREVTKSADFKIDKTPPITLRKFEGFIGIEGWFVSDVIVTLSATDARSGVNYTMHKLNDGDWITYVEPFFVTEDGDYTLYYYSVDLA
ncbi:unnamed protein product, partial [marine sediment metagenome]